MGYQGDGEDGREDGREMAWLVGRRVDMSGQAEQELGKGVGLKGEKKFGREMGQEVGT